MVDKHRAEEFAEGKRRLEEIGNKLGELLGKPNTGAIFSTLGGLLENVGKLAEQSGGGEFTAGNQVKGVYGFTIKTVAGQPAKVEPFGNLKRDEQGKLVEVQAIREPLIDIFDELDHLLIVAEVPGITQADVQLALQDDILVFSAKNNDCQYHKELLLPASFSAEQMRFTCRNGLLEIRFNK